MDLDECAKIVLKRIQQVEPVDANKVISYLLLNHSYQQIMQYVYGSDKQILSLILEAKSFFKSIVRPFLPSLSPPPSPGYDLPVPYWKPQLLPTNCQLLHNNVNNLPFAISPNGPTGALHSPLLESIGFEKQLQLLSMLGDDMLSNYFNPHLCGIADPCGSPESPTRACHYYSRGFCRNGAKCRFFHRAGVPEVCNEGQICALGSLDKLEMEIRELLMLRGGMPVSIASLPMLYLEKYGKMLQADGYLTESQRHGKASCSLTKLLLRFQTISVIERPHGQHAVVLVEDAHKYLEYKADGCDLMDAGGGSNQIYLTFPAESTFTDEHIRNYFKQYGPVCDVRIPRQEKRMFGFVGFLYPETVRLILAKGNPHFICGARVLVKPYKEKPKPDRKHAEKDIHFDYCAPRVSDVTWVHHATVKLSRDTEFFQKKLNQGRELGIDIETKHMIGLEAASSPLTHKPPFNHGLEAQNFAEGDHLRKPSDVNQSEDASPDQDSGEVNLPESLDLY